MKQHLHFADPQHWSPTRAHAQPLLYSLFTHDCVAMHADDTTVVGLITPIYIDGIAVEKVERSKFFGVHITDKSKWSTHTDSVVKKAQQHLF